MPEPLRVQRTVAARQVAHGTSHQSVERALAVLSAFDDVRVELGVGELSRICGLHKSTVSRLAATLERAGFLRRAGERYRLGMEPLRLGAVAVASFDPLSATRPAMERLSALSGETVNLAVPDGDAVLNVAEIPGTFILSASDGWTGRRTAPHAAANGKVLLAFGALALRPDAPLERYTERTITDRRLLEAELERTRERGYAIAVSELEIGLAAAAAPVFDGEGRCVAAISVSGPEVRLGPEDLDRLGRLAAGD
ncbi:MAG TPA: IclR family transcriptional regulator [Acidimicrobiales bacterium]|nr:IclR family transcriptional regulator [Acidimicrobiales bacterium]